MKKYEVHLECISQADADALSVILVHCGYTVYHSSYDFDSINSTKRQVICFTADDETVSEVTV